MSQSIFYHGPMTKLNLKSLPDLALTPVMKAVAVPAESAVCLSTLYVFDSAAFGNVSQLNTFSSPVKKTVKI